MKYACGIIRDLLPLYLDEVAAAESRAAVEEHIAVCAECAQLYRLMQSEDPFEAEREQYMQKQMQEQEQQLQGSLLQVKRRLNSKTRRAVLGALLGLVLLFGSWQVLFQLPLKSVDDFSVEVQVLPLSDLAQPLRESALAECADGPTAVWVSAGPDDDSEMVSIYFNPAGQTVVEMDGEKRVNPIPVTGEPPAEDEVELHINVSEEVVERDKYISVLSWQSPYNIKRIEFDAENSGDGVVAISGAKTTLLGNKAKDGSGSGVMLEFKQIRKVVYISKDGEKLLWQQ